ncbi:hypothetical protein O181_015173 [Austropuccinia psidii MF-1]|uniref:J domain-containing protein n=1 Tax=Austropuccinia psidii MF-1 TaxID=1389203 RepID=A0A9Q3C1Z2_9BASI|nr:hypothetical protein [Austropuccinia psidii MF-1]
MILHTHPLFTNLLEVYSLVQCQLKNSTRPSFLFKIKELCNSEKTKVKRLVSIWKRSRSYMFYNDYDSASKLFEIGLKINFENQIDEITDFRRRTILELSQCKLMLSRSFEAIKILELLWNPKSPISINFKHELFSTLALLWSLVSKKQSEAPSKQLFESSIEYSNLPDSFIYPNFELYKILCIHENASVNEIDESYRRLKGLLHENGSGVENLLDEFNNAYEVLSCPEK